MQAKKFSFLITGAGRGGTSLLAGLLASHPKLEVGFEHYMHHLLGQIPSSAQDSTSRLLAFRRACEQSAAECDKIWGNKITTEQIGAITGNPLDEAAIDLFYDFHSDLKHIFILRDGRTCVRSKVARTGQPVEEACANWLYSAKVFHHFESGHVNGIAIKFEDLLRDPVSALKEICRHLSIVYCEDMLRGTNHPGMLPEYRRTGFDVAPMQVAPIEDRTFQLIERELRACAYLAETTTQ